MPELDLKLGDLNLRLILVRHEADAPRQPYQDWFSCEVLAAVPSFSGRFHWSVMPGELLDLARDLQALYDQFPNRGSSVGFAPIEPNVTLNFEIGTTGQVQGRYRLRDDLVIGGVLEGSFTMEQNSIPVVAGNIRAFVQEASATL